jgi:hypothetical protein
MAGSFIVTPVETGVQERVNLLKLDSRVRGNDGKGRFFSVCDQAPSRGQQTASPRLCRGL